MKINIRNNGPELTQQETEFLPAVLEVTETPPSPTGRLVLWSIMLLLAIVLLWLIFGHVDEVAVAPGKIIPTGQVKVVQAEDKGVVKQILVKEGQDVKKGELLLELDPTMTAADLALVKKELAYYTLDIERLLAEREGRAFTQNSIPDLDSKDLEYQLSLYQSRTAAFRAKTASAQATIEQSLAAIEVAKATKAKYQEMLVIAREKEERLEGLYTENAVALFYLLDQRAKRIELEQNVTGQIAEILRNEATLAKGREELASVAAERDKDIMTALVEDRKKIASYQEELKKAEEKNRLARIVAPVDGRINQLAIHTVGGVVTPAQAILNVVPDGTILEIEAWVANKDIGFIQIGQRAEVKVETFNFQKYGVIDAEVVEISPDAVSSEQTQDQQKSKDKDKQQQALNYRVILKIEKDHVVVGDRLVPLSPGMAVTAEIKTRKKRIIEFFLDPFKKYQSEALRER